MAMKSAYELAMERLAKQAPQSSRKLTAKDKARLAELDRVYQAKIAEQELTWKPQIADIRAKGDPEATAKLEDEFRSRIQNLRREWETAKEKVRQGTG